MLYMGKNEIKNERRVWKSVLNKYGFYSPDQEGFIEMWHAFNWSEQGLKSATCSMFALVAGCVPLSHL